MQGTGWQSWAAAALLCRVALTPVAIMEGMAFAATVFGGKPTPPDYQKACRCPLHAHPRHKCRTMHAMTFRSAHWSRPCFAQFEAMHAEPRRDERTFMKLLVHAASDQARSLAQPSGCPQQIWPPLMAHSFPAACCRVPLGFLPCLALALHRCG